MSHSSSIVASSNFQQVINDALRLYKKRTRNDPLNNPLASELQVCDSPAAILAVLQQQVEGPDESRSRRTKWLVPTVKVLYTFSATLEERASMVSLRPQDVNLSETCTPHIHMAAILPGEGDIYRRWCTFLSAHRFSYPRTVNITPAYHRLSRMFARAKMPSSGSLSVSKAIFNVLKSIRKYRRPRR